MNTLHDNRADYQYCKDAPMTRWEAEKELEKFSYNEQEAARIYAIAKEKGGSWMRRGGCRGISGMGS